MTGRRCVPARIVQALALLLLAALAACTQTKAFQTQGQEARQPIAEPRILIMPGDVELSEVSAGGLLEPNAVWTEAGRRNVDAALDAVLAEKGARLLRYDSPGGGLAYDEAHIQTVKLFEAVGGTILRHRYGAQKLPTKGEGLDWTLGEGVDPLRRSYEADYALFTFLRDSFASSGRQAMIVVGALLGVGVRGGYQVGFASLVDLRSGQIVWFNRLRSETGDLRDPVQAQVAVRQLLTEIPL